ncbi:hypothetical protein GGQ84_000490 [Desulfitispora alkaliphila]
MGEEIDTVEEFDYKVSLLEERLAKMLEKGGINDYSTVPTFIPSDD